MYLLFPVLSSPCFSSQLAPMAVQETIDLTTVIDHIDSHMPFDIAYVTADKKRGTGGQIKQHKGWVKCDLSSQPEMVLRKNKIRKNFTYFSPFILIFYDYL
jgi:hypothetical protein